MERCQNWLDCAVALHALLTSGWGSVSRLLPQCGGLSSLPPGAFLCPAGLPDHRAPPLPMVPLGVR